MTTKNLLHIDWNSLPVPQDDGSADSLLGRLLPDAHLRSTDNALVNPASLHGWAVIYVYPMTAKPDSALPDGWDEIPGARGCTPQACAFRDHFNALRDAGAEHVFGLSTQDHHWQKEAHDRLHLPFALLSDADLQLGDSLNLPSFSVDRMTLYKRLTLVVHQGEIRHVFFPVFPPDKNPQQVIYWFQENAAKAKDG